MRVGGEADLVVRDDVDRAAGRVARERLQVEHFGDDALRGERRVAVDEDRGGDLRVEARTFLLRSVCSARVMPSTTPSTASRCEGLFASSTVIFVPIGVTYVPFAP